MSNSTKRATRVAIAIGDISLDVYQLPDGGYRLAGRQVTDAIGEPANGLSRFYGVRGLKALPGADKGLLQVRTDEGGSFIPVTIEDAINFWVGMVAKGNSKARALVVALAAETLERRADRALGIQRKEEEYDASLLLRLKRLEARFRWTEVIKEYQQAQGIYLTPQGERQFRGLTVQVNQRLFGVAHFRCDRDNMTPEQQTKIQVFEHSLRERYDLLGRSRSLEALVQECLDFFFRK